jgi:hypothetical protein
VDAEGKIFGRFKEIDFAFEEEGVGAEVYVFFTGDEAFDDFIDLGMDQGFTAGMETIGAPHSSAASQHCWGVSLLLRT